MTLKASKNFQNVKRTPKDREKLLILTRYRKFLLELAFYLWICYPCINIFGNLYQISCENALQYRLLFSKIRWDNCSIMQQIVKENLPNPNPSITASRERILDRISQSFALGITNCCKERWHEVTFQLKYFDPYTWPSPSHDKFEHFTAHK